MVIRLIFRKANEKTGEFVSLDRRGLGTIVVYVLTLIARWQVLGQAQGVAYAIEIITDAVITGSLFVVALYIVNLLRSPFLVIAELHQSLLGYQLKAKSPFTLIPFNPEQKLPNKWISIRLFNNSEIATDECVIRLESIVALSENHRVENAPEELRWSAINQPLTGKKTVPPQGDVIADVAYSDASLNRILFTTQRGDMYSSGKGNYRIHLRAFSNTALPKDFYGIVIYKGNNDVLLEQDSAS